MAKYNKLKDAMAASSTAAPATKAATAAGISEAQAEFLSELGASGFSGNDRARGMLRTYLEDVADGNEVSDEQARAALVVLRSASTSTHRGLCDRILSKYILKFKAYEYVEAKATAGVA